MKQFYLCGGCEHYHPLGWTGDCRDDSQRFPWFKLDELYGLQDKGWEEVNEETGEPT